MAVEALQQGLRVRGGLEAWILRDLAGCRARHRELQVLERPPRHPQARVRRGDAADAHAVLERPSKQGRLVDVLAGGRRVSSRDSGGGDWDHSVRSERASVGEAMMSSEAVEQRSGNVRQLPKPLVRMTRNEVLQYSKKVNYRFDRNLVEKT